MYRKARIPTTEQAEIIESAGLNPRKWLVVEDGKAYLRLTDRSLEQRDEVTINKSSLRMLQMPW